MEILAKDVGKIVVLKPLTKAVDAHVSQDFKNQITEIIKEGSLNIILDFSLVNFVDSSGLGTLLACLKLVREHKGNFSICRVAEAPKSLFKLTGMTEQFNLFDQEDEAVKAMEEKIQ